MQQESRCAEEACRDDVEQLIGHAREVAAYDVTSNFAMAVQSGCVGGAPVHHGDGTVQHPDAATFNTAIWALLGDPYDALARGGA